MILHLCLRNRLRKASSLLASPVRDYDYDDDDDDDDDYYYYYYYYLPKGISNWEVEGKRKRRNSWDRWMSGGEKMHEEKILTEKDAIDGTYGDRGL